MSRWRIKPSLGNVLVQPQEEAEISAGGIHLVTTVERETHIAEVIEVCAPYEFVRGDSDLIKQGPIWTIGQLVIIGKYNGRDIKIDRERFIIIRESDVLGTLEEHNAG